MPAQWFVLATMAHQPGLQIAFSAASIDVISGLEGKLAQGADLDLAALLEMND